MGRWVPSAIGAVNLDQLAQLGVEWDPISGRPERWSITGWSPTGDRFAVAVGFATRQDAETALEDLLDSPQVDHVDACPCDVCDARRGSPSS